ncbi:hypothetical protein VTK73DRAFT_372 [Phialemonium thermophilum]|uniref:Ppx/GppA phosphatase domain-containing protein n=1 Tax=Phialemonium thermophilum TaxID=223376 RepID=A0ABR3XFJ6_9PEZI
MRSARNAGAMLDAINAKIPDLKIHILAPEVETLLGSMGARSSFVLAKGLFLDLGGGSVQMTYLDTTGPSNRAGQGPSYEVLAAKTGRSMPYGAARLTKILESGDENVQAAETSILKASMRQAFQDLLQNHPALNTVSLPGQSELMHDGDGIDIYLCGGGFRGYGSMLMHNDPTQPYPIPSVATYTVSGSYFGQTKKMLQTNDEYEGKIYGMSKRRRAQFPAIVAVVEAVIEAVPKIRSVTFCGGGNREGFLMMKLPRELRESNPLDLIGVPCSAAGGANSGLEDSLQSVMLTLRSALPHANILSVFTLGLGPVFTRKLWDGIGNESGINASVSLHEAVRQDPGCPGLTHLARAILGLTLCARWAPTSKLLPLDRQIRDGFRRLAGTTDLQASFWAHYIGAVAAVMTTVVPAWPRSPRRVIEAIKFRATSDNENTKLKFRLVISLSLRAAEGLDLPALEKLIREAGKDLPDGKIGKTVAVHIEVLNT